MPDRESILNALRQMKEELNKRYKVKEIGLFGSFARTDESESSDIDILVEFEKDADFLDLVALGNFLENAFGKKIDIVTRKAIRPEIRNKILEETAMV